MNIFEQGEISRKEENNKMITIRMSAMIYPNEYLDENWLRDHPFFYEKGESCRVFQQKAKPTRCTLWKEKIPKGTLSKNKHN